MQRILRRQRIISINSKLFNNRDCLEREYQMLVDAGKFVKGTTYRSVAWHELGHIVANIYSIEPMKVAKQVMENHSSADIIKYIKRNLSLYAADYEDGKEFISECFSAYYEELTIGLRKSM